MKARYVGVGLLVVALATVLAFAQSGTVTSANRVGYVKLTLPASAIVLCGMNFTRDNASINEVLKEQLYGGLTEGDGDNLIKWDASNARYNQYFKFDTHGNPMYSSLAWLDGKWLARGDYSGPSSVTLGEGDGFWLWNKQASPQDVFLLGEVVDADSGSITFDPGLRFFSYPFSATVKLNDTSMADDGAYGGLTEGSGDNVVAWDSNNARYNYYFLFHTHGDPLYASLAWMDGQWLARGDYSGPSQTSLDLSKGFWFWRKGSGSFEWKEPRPYSE